MEYIEQIMLKDKTLDCGQNEPTKRATSVLGEFVWVVCTLECLGVGWLIFSSFFLNVSLIG